MASAPSASALSAVLRCRGKIWTRNPPTPRPAAAWWERGEEDSRDRAKGSHPKLAQPAGSARPAAAAAAAAAPGDPVRRLARALTLNLLGGDKCSKITARGTVRARARVRVRDAGGSTWRLSVTSDGAALRSARLSLSALLLGLRLLCARSGHEEDAPRHQRDEEDAQRDPLRARAQAAGRIHRTEERPD